MDGALVFSNWTATGTHKDTGKPLTLKGMSFAQLNGTTVAKEVHSWDRASELTQLGYTFTPPEGNPATLPTHMMPK